MERIYYRDQVLETIARKVLCAYDPILFTEIRSLSL